MILTTTTNIEGRTIEGYLGIVCGEVIIGANIFRDLFAGIRDIVGGRAGAYEDALEGARQQVMEELQAKAARLGASAIIGIDLDYEVLGQNGGMMMVTASGTAVRLG